MNILTFDIEEWFLEKELKDSPARLKEYDRCLKSVLDLLDERNIKATFFCLGKIAEHFPEVIKSIHEHGHEIGCHSDTHKWLTKLTPNQLKQDTHDAIARLEDIYGEKVKSYRAPAFSIGESNKWAFEILAENGIERDCSIFPAKRDFGGFPDFKHTTPCIVESSGLRIKEFPIQTTRLFFSDLTYSGGGYFRLFPLPFIKSRMKNNPYNICYFHIGDLVNTKEEWKDKLTYESSYQEKGNFTARLSRYIKSNIGKSHAFKKMTNILNSFDFIDLREADKIIDWKSANIVRLSPNSLKHPH